MHESESIERFFKTIPKDRKVTIIDVGAQSGLYALFAKYLPLSTIHAFEPFKPTFDVLNENIKLNDIGNVLTYNTALSDKQGTTILNTSSSHNGLHTMGNNPLRFNDIVPVTIETNTIDNMFIDTPTDYIKIDTEGWEYHILLGAVNTLIKYRPHIQLEWNTINMKQCGIEPSKLWEFLTTLGYVQVAFIGEELFMSHKSRLNWST